jgi:hypothetical protein
MLRRKVKEISLALWTRRQIIYVSFLAVGFVIYAIYQYSYPYISNKIKGHLQIFLANQEEE